ncbi:MAG: transcriptional regulator [Armatimonadaceae bacterium]
METQHAPPDAENGALTRAAAILHPVRIQIILTLQNQPLTTLEIQERLPEIAQATLYRQINRLIEAGIVTVIEERRVHGTVERLLALDRERTQVTREEFEQIPAAELTRYFGSFLGGLMEVFERFVRNAPIPRDPEKTMTFFQEMVYMTPEEAREVRREMRQMVERLSANEPTGRKRHLVAVFSIPDTPAAKRQAKRVPRRKRTVSTIPPTEESE